MKNPTIKEMTEKVMRETGYDGLWNDEFQCQCAIGDTDFMNCETPWHFCRAGYCRPADKYDGDVRYVVTPEDE